MTRFASIIAAAALAGIAAAPAAAQYQPYPQQYQQPYPQPYPQPAPSYPYSGQTYGNDQGVVGTIVDSLIGNRYAVGDRQAIRSCAWAAVQRAQRQNGGGYGNGYGRGVRVTSIDSVDRRTLVIRVRGTLGRSGGYGGGPGYNGPGYNGPGYNGPGYNGPGYNAPGGPGYGNNGYGGGGYSRPEFNFRCDVNYNGYVQNVRLEPLGRGY
jgi:hypothetical protein